MSIIKINPDVNENQEWEVLPPGIYQLRCCKPAEVKEPSQEGKSQTVPMEWEITDGEHVGKKIFDTLVLHPKMEFRIKQCALACGIEVDAEGNIDVDLFIGSQCSAKVGTKTSEYQGEMQIKNVIKKYLIES